MAVESPMYPDLKTWNRLERAKEKKQFLKESAVKGVGRFVSNGHEFVWTVGRRNDRRHGAITTVKPDPYFEELYRCMFRGWRNGL